ncbi:MAG: hypothetical protein ACJ790_05120 [Myxococcaceae bacterium]
MQRPLSILLLGALLCACTREKPLPASLQGELSVKLSEERKSANGVKAQTVFQSALEKALTARGLTVKPGAPNAVTGKVTLSDESVKDSKIGGPMAFFFVEGAYDVKLQDETGKEIGHFQSGLDVHALNEKALPSAHISYDDTVRAIAEDAAPKLAEQIARKLFEAGRVAAR